MFLMFLKVFGNQSKAETASHVGTRVEVERTAGLKRSLESS